MKGNLENKSSNSLFHFTNSKIAIEHILPTLQLKLGLIEKTNDPRENKTWGFGAMNGNFQKGQEISDQENWNNKLTKLLRKNVKVICFSSDYKIENEWYDGYNLPRMWAQYGENHKGICIELDKEIFQEENNNTFSNTYFEPVEYDIEREYPWIDFPRIDQLGLDVYVDEFRKSNYRFLFFSKFIDWQSEREIRLLKVSNTNLEEYMFIRKSIKKIILGIDFNDVYLPTIIKLANGIRIDRIKSENGHLISLPFREEYLQSIMTIKNKS